MQALGCIFGAVVLMFAQFGVIVYGIFAGINIFVAYIIRQWGSGAKLYAILLYGVLSGLIAFIWGYGKQAHRGMLSHIRSTAQLQSRTDFSLLTTRPIFYWYSALSSTQEKQGGVIHLARSHHSHR